MKIRRDLNQGTKEWFEAKLGVVTATDLKKVRGTPAAREKYMNSLIAERLTPEIDMEFIHENAMARGSRLEPEAVLAFEYVTGIKTEKAGLVEHGTIPFLAYSPDALIPNKYTEDVETKCPEGQNYMEIVRTRKVPKEYEDQIVHAFLVNDKLKKRYFVAYNPDIPSDPIVIIEVTRESIEKDIEEARKDLMEFLADYELEFEKVAKPTV